MLTDVDLPAHLQPLLRYGDDESLRTRPDGWHNYVAELGLTADDAPLLLAVMDGWFQIPFANEADDEDHKGEPDASWCAPIHAWRALGQLGAVEAVAPMLAQADPLDEAEDDWSMEEWPEVFGMIGPAAIPGLAAHAADGSHREFARVLAINGLVKIVDRRADAREQAVRALTEQLARHENAPIVNASIVGALMDLHAGESAEVIERAFAADVIDESSCGGWGDVREKLGVVGLGLAPIERRKHWWTQHYQFRSNFDRPHDPEKQARDREKAKREKAKRKAAAQAKKRNRRAK
jgi:hypothetical protein